MKEIVTLIAVLAVFTNCTNSQQQSSTSEVTQVSIPSINTMWTDKVVKTEAEWKQQLSADEYEITREKGTERPFSHAYNDSKKEGLIQRFEYSIELAWKVMKDYLQSENVLFEQQLCEGLAGRRRMLLLSLQK